MSAQGSGNGNTSLARRVIRGALWVLLIIFLLFVALVIYRIPAVNEQKQSAQTVAQIQAQHLTLADADGSNLPPVPDPKLVDATVVGVDANNNGIRDDVELAIFKLYPNSPYTRAAELQYAMTEQMFLTDVFDTATWKAVAEIDDRADSCLSQFDYSKSGVLRGQVENLVFNAVIRKAALESAASFTTSYGTQKGELCDVDASKLPQ